MNEIFEYVRARGRKTGQIRGVVLATTRPRLEGNPPEIVMGWSQANESAGDKFNKPAGLAIARTRALNGLPQKLVPHEASKVAKRLLARAEKYFKGATL